jgi:hypothetical protein
VGFDRFAVDFCLAAYFLIFFLFFLFTTQKRETRNGQTEVVIEMDKKATAQQRERGKGSE